MKSLTCGCEYVDSMIFRYCEAHKYPGPESHKDGKGILVRDLERQIQELRGLLTSVNQAYTLTFGGDRGPLAAAFRAIGQYLKGSE